MTASCPICHREASPLFTTKDRNRGTTDTRFSYFRCGPCGLIFLSPVPSDLGAYYPQDYYSIPRDLGSLRAAAELERYKIEIVRRFAAGGRLLEIGPAYGSFLCLARQAGFEAEAIEMDPGCCDFIRGTLGVPVTESADPARAIGQSEPYEVVALWHVIEHLSDPWTVLAAIAEKIRPGGILVLAAPNPNSLQFRIQGRLWPHVDAPRHVLLAPTSLLVEQLRPLGLRAIWETTDDAGARGWNAFGWEFFFMNFSRRRRIKRILRLLGVGVATVLAPFERKETKGSAYTMVFHKEPLG